MCTQIGSPISDLSTARASSENYQVPLNVLQRSTDPREQTVSRADGCQTRIPSTIAPGRSTDQERHADQRGEASPPVHDGHRGGIVRPSVALLAQGHIPNRTSRIHYDFLRPSLPQPPSYRGYVDSKHRYGGRRGARPPPRRRGEWRDVRPSGNCAHTR